MFRSSSGGRDVVVRWRALAAQRLDHLTELHRTGRWKRYHREQAFLEMIDETREALAAWERLVPSDPAFDEMAEIRSARVMDENADRHDSLPVDGHYGVRSDHVSSSRSRLSSASL